MCVLGYKCNSYCEKLFKSLKNINLNHLRLFVGAGKGTHAKHNCLERMIKIRVLSLRRELGNDFLVSSLQLKTDQAVTGLVVLTPQTPWAERNAFWLLYICVSLSMHYFKLRMAQISLKSPSGPCFFDTSCPPNICSPLTDIIEILSGNMATPIDYFPVSLELNKYDHVTKRWAILGSQKWCKGKIKVIPLNGGGQGAGRGRRDAFFSFSSLLPRTRTHLGPHRPRSKHLRDGDATK